jgi:iron complex outermembrane receptor protein
MEKSVMRFVMLRGRNSMGVKSFGLRQALLMGAATFGLAIGAALAAQPAYAQQAMRTYDIPAQDLGMALREFGRQSGRDILFTPDATAGKRSPGVHGQLTERDALETLLNGSGLRFELTASSGYAVQSAASPTQLGAEQAAPSDDEQIVVTGTRIRGRLPVGTPLTVYNRDDIDRTGATTLEQFARVMPDNYSSAQATNIAPSAGNGYDQTGSNAFGGAAFNIHGLGPGATLTLVDGHRLSPAGTGGAFTDISLIPLSAVDRVEVLGDGASAIYGADAVAGVVNVILKHDFDGQETSLRVASDSDGGGNEFVGSQSLGHSWRSGNAMLVYEHGELNALTTADRSFIPSQLTDFDITPNEDRNSAFGVVRQQLSEDATISGEALYSNRRSVISSSLGGGLNENIVAENRQWSASLDFQYHLNADWTSETNLQHSELTQNANILPFAIEIDTNSALTEANTTLEGPIPGWRGARTVFGAAYKTETITPSIGVDLSRNVTSLFGEAYLPLFDAANSRPGFQRLILSLAARYDSYSDFGAATSPRVGLLWEPTLDLSLRASYGKSFRPPLLSQLTNQPNFITIDLPNAADSDGVTDTLINFASGNPDLRPERANSYTFTVEFHPQAVPHLTATASYFHTTFSGRIGNPPIPGGLFELFNNLSTIGSFVDVSPDPAAVQAIFDSGTVFDDAAHGAGGVEATYDDRLTNLAQSREAGLDAGVSYTFDTSVGNVSLSAGATYLIQNDFVAVAGTNAISLRNIIGEPLRLKARVGASWSDGPLSASLFANYSDTYRNILFVPPEKIDARTTWDLHLSYAPQHGGVTHGFEVRMDIQNIFDEAPPRVGAPIGAGFDVGYDAANADPNGRRISLQLVDRW